MRRFIYSILSFFPGHNAKIIARKQRIRKYIREFKRQIPEAQKQSDADLVFQKIELLPQFQTAHSVLLYWSTTDELPTHDFVKKWSGEKEILLPSVVDNDIEIKRFETKKQLKKGSLGIWEPESLENYSGEIDLVIVPGMAFDNKKNRLGRGKGYYDRFFKNPKTIKWGVCFDFQLISSIPVNKNDVRMDKIITPKQIIE